MALRTPKRVSYFFMLATFVVVGSLHMATPLLAALFSYLALTLHTTFDETMRMGVLPFLVGDMFKAALIAGAATAVLPKESHTGDRS